MKSIKLSLVFNILIFVFVLFATVAMYTGFEFMGHADQLVASSVKMLQFYTVQSNLLMGLMALVFVIYDILLLKGKISKMPNALYLLKLTFTVGVSVTLLTVVLYLTPITKGAAMLYINANLFYHLLVPLLAIATLVFFEKSNAISFKHTPLCLLPTVLYGIYYIINAFTHVVDGKVPAEYDWYLFAQGGTIATILAFTIMLLFTYVLTLVLWKLNKKTAN